MSDSADNDIHHLHDLTLGGIYLLNARQPVRDPVFSVCHQVNLAVEPFDVSAVIALIRVDENVASSSVEATNAVDQELKIHAVDAGFRVSSLECSVTELPELGNDAMEVDLLLIDERIKKIDNRFVCLCPLASSKFRPLRFRSNICGIFNAPNGGSDRRVAASLKCDPTHHHIPGIAVAATIAPECKLDGGIYGQS